MLHTSNETCLVTLCLYPYSYSYFYPCRLFFFLCHYHSCLCSCPCNHLCPYRHHLLCLCLYPCHLYIFLCHHSIPLLLIWLRMMMILVLRWGYRWCQKVNWTVTRVGYITINRLSTQKHNEVLIREKRINIIILKQRMLTVAVRPGCGSINLVTAA